MRHPRRASETYRATTGPPTDRLCGAALTRRLILDCQRRPTAPRRATPGASDGPGHFPVSTEHSGQPSGFSTDRGVGRWGAPEEDDPR